MKFIHGMMWGTIITAGAMMCYSEPIDCQKKKVLKRGKQIAKRMGIFF